MLQTSILGVQPAFHDFSCDIIAHRGGPAGDAAFKAVEALPQGAAFLGRFLLFDGLLGSRGILGRHSALAERGRQWLKVDLNRLQRAGRGPALAAREADDYRIF